MRFLRLGLAAMMFAAACGPRTQESEAPEPVAAPSARQRDIITREELLSSAHQGQDLYAAIQSLRPQFLQTPLGVRRASADPATAVYVDRARQPGLNALRTILTSNVEEVRYLDPMQSQNAFGTLASSGAVVVTLHKAEKP